MEFSELFDQSKAFILCSGKAYVFLILIHPLSTGKHHVNDTTLYHRLTRAKLSSCTAKTIFIVFYAVHPLPTGQSVQTQQNNSTKQKKYVLIPYQQGSLFRLNTAIPKLQQRGVLIPYQQGSLFRLMLSVLIIVSVVVLIPYQQGSLFRLWKL